MKKNLRLLCLGLAAATFTCSFAQEAQNMTDKLTNADMELGLKGWGFDGEKLMGKNTKNPAVQTGFYGMANGVLEAWNGNGNGLANAYIMQRIGNLPNGTYVFGANIGASKQYHRKAVTVTVNGKDVTKYEYWSNLDSVKGVELYANEAIVPVATNNPDYNNMVTADGSTYTDGHAMKFNVAVTLTAEDEKPGYLDAGLRYVNTNANYVVWDNATLYYFGEMSEEDALEAMAKIDVANAIAIADTLKNTHIANDTLKNLTEALAAAEKAEFTAANFNDVLEVVYRAAGLARKSASDYKTLANNIKSARVVAAGTWQETDFNKNLLSFLNGLIADGEAAYEAKEMNREELTALRKEINWTAADLKLDSLYLAREVLSKFIDAARNLEGQPGGYTAIQIQGLQELIQEVSDTIGVYEADSDLEFAERTIDPSGLYGYIARINTAIESVKNNPISAEYTKMPIEFKTAENGWIEHAEWFDESKKIVAYISPMYRFQGKVSNFRITVKKAKNGQQYFCLSGLEFFDGNGQKIELTEDDLSTNADHNTLNPGAEDGGGIAALFDENHDTYFHSAWQNSPAEAHYLEVNLPNGGYDAFSFRMLSRSNSNGWDQSHTFPGEMVISTPAPKRDALEVLVNQAKGYNAYSFPEVGYYEYDHSYLLDAIAEAEALVKSYGSEDDCVAMADKLSAAMAQFELSEEKGIRFPEPGKEYRIVSGFNGYYDIQGVEKALTVHAADTTLWWETLAADSLQQIFIFEPIGADENGIPTAVVESGENEDGTTWEVIKYCYKIKNKAYDLYFDSVFVDNKFRLAEEAYDTIFLKHLGRGQWNIEAGGTFHCGDHNSGNPSESKGAYGGIAGISSGICSYGGGLDGASAWYIREYPSLPRTVEVEGAEFKSEFIRFASANTIKLTADKACAFDGLALYDLYGAALAVDTVVVKDNVATITAKKNLVGCSFAFNNAEGVASVEFDAYHFISKISLLEEAYEAAAAVAPVEGEGVGEYADVAEYTAALEAAEAMIEAGAATDAEVEAMIARLEAAVEGLVVNLPVEGKYYFIYNAVEAFEKNHGYKMAMYTADYDLKWGHENHLDYNRYWQFELATEEELEMLIEDEKTIKNLLGKAFFMKSVGTELYIADGAQSEQVGLTDDKEAALPYLVNVLGAGKEVSFDGLGQSGKRIHANGHGGGVNKGSNIVYWGSGAGTASAWHVVETQYDVTDIDFTEIETEQAVVKGAYDLFGRRIVAPTAPGIYIIDGKKKYIKK